MDRPYMLIANVKSGRRDRRRIEELRAGLCRALGSPVRFLPVRGGDGLEEAAQEAARAGRGTCFVAGGDGTISGVAHHLQGSGVTLAPLPLGTFNFFCRGLVLPEDEHQAIAALVEGTAAPQVVGEINGRVFLNNCSFGLYPSILAAREDIYNHWGRSRLAAYWSVLKTLMRPGRRMRLTITADGETRQVRTPMIFVGINPYQLDFYRLDGAEAARQGKLVLFYGADSGRFGLIRSALRLGLGLARREREFHMVTGRDITIGMPWRDATVAIDGERIRVAEPIRLRAREDLIRVLRPQAADAAQERSDAA